MTKFLVFTGHLIVGEDEVIIDETPLKFAVNFAQIESIQQFPGPFEFEEDINNIYDGFSVVQTLNHSYLLNLDVAGILEQLSNSDFPEINNN